MARATLTYCTNVHPGETLDEVERSLDRFVVPLRAKLAAEGAGAGVGFAVDPFPVGLWFSAATARALAERGRRERFAGFLAQRRLAIATLNCFPHGGFHDATVKFEVYRPTWGDEARVGFTLDAARALAELVPAGTRTAISTLPLSCKRFGDDAAARARGAENVARVAAGLARLAETTAREIVLSLEPEPCATLETTAETVAFFEEQLFSAGGRAAFVAAGGDAGRAEELLRRHVGVCFDCCHQAVEFEEADAALARLAAAAIRIGKVQVSSALRLALPADPARVAALARFAEPRWLHQAFVRRGDGSVRGVFDLPDLLADARELATARELRSHFHVPVDRACVGPNGELGTTRDFLEAALARARADRLAETFEIETYTFPVLPDGPDGDAALVEAIAAEFCWTRAQLDEPPRTG
jgi:sugar phosphate isomerase/epimerase